MSSAATAAPLAALPASTSRLSLHNDVPASRPVSPSHDVASTPEPAPAAAPAQEPENAPAPAPTATDALPPYTRSAAPPPYIESEEPSDKEPNTLARQLFQYGFIFPLFWFVGIFILSSSLNAPENWEETKTEDERRELLAVLRATEVCFLHPV